MPVTICIGTTVVKTDRVASGTGENRVRRWGVIVSAYYGVILVVLLIPAAHYLGFGSETESLSSVYDKIMPALFDLEAIVGGGWIGWVGVAILVSGQMLLLGVTVDASQRRLRPQRRLIYSVVATTIAVGALTLAGLGAIAAAILSDEVFGPMWLIIGAPLASWLIWGLVFYAYRRHLSENLDRVLNGLLGGSVLQLLIAIPCHVIVRNRDDCSAPWVTGYGIATGVAVMLIAFGPSVIFLYQRRLLQYGREPDPDLTLPRRVISFSLGTLAVGTLALFVLLPVEDGWTLYPDIPVAESEAATAAVDGLIDSFGMTITEADQTGMRRIHCHGDYIGHVSAFRPNEEMIQTWPIWLRADQRNLAFALEEALGSHTTGLLFVFYPARLNEWRSLMAHGTLIGLGCHQQ